MQTTLNFTASPINVDRIKGQNKRLLDHLQAGNTIHCFSDACRKLKIHFLNSRISDLSNKNGIGIYKRFIEVKDSAGESVTVKEYSMYPFKVA